MNKDTIYQYKKVITSKLVGFICVRIDRPVKDQLIGPFKYRCSISFQEIKRKFNIRGFAKYGNDAYKLFGKFNKYDIKKACDGKIKSNNWAIELIYLDKQPLKNFMAKIVEANWESTKVIIPEWAKKTVKFEGKIIDLFNVQIEEVTIKKEEECTFCGITHNENITSITNIDISKIRKTKQQ